jgi:DNA polymerase delta subunit 2
MTFLLISVILCTYLHFRLKSITGVTNPWIGKISDLVIIGTSGQPIQNIQKVCGHDTLEPIEWLERSLEWRHLCPTAPDTIPCMPFYKNDPFILKECPHIYFVGNMDKFQTKLYKGLRNIVFTKFCTFKINKKCYH